MALATTARLVNAAVAGGYAVGAFNVITVEHAESIVQGAERAGRPVILQISENAVRFHRSQLSPITEATLAVARAAAVPAAVHLDHATLDRLVHEAADAGFSSVMYDAAHLPYEQNVAATRDAAGYAHERGLWLEGELGEVGGKDGPPPDPHAPGARTEPVEAARFVAATGVDALAVAVGTAHAMTRREAVLDHGLIARLRDAVPVPLVLHGSSGVPEPDLRRAVLAGIAKVNIGTALNTAFTGALQAYLAEHPGTVDPRGYLGPARDAMAAVVARYVSLLAAP